MKVSSLLVIAALAGAVAVIGCEDSGGTGGNGTGGTGGNGTGGTGGTEPCAGGNCANDQALADSCETLITECNALGAGGAGGAGGATEPPTAEECDAYGEAFCNVDTGAGGAGGDGGAGGAGVPPDPIEVCDEGLCADPGEPRDRCQTILVLCLEFALEAQWDECVAAALLSCNAE